MTNLNTSLLSKGVFGVGVVAIAGIIGAVHFAQAATNNDTSGYGTTSQQSVAASDTLETAVANDLDSFSGDISGLQNQAQQQLISNDANAAFDGFDTSYNTATQTYADSVSTAFNTFRDQISADATTATSKDQFIDEFNNAKADYLNSLDAAKNQLASSLSNLAGNGNVVKDQFIDGFNSERDAYSNSLEQAKNDFAATLG
jgi:archaellum component FlaC